MEIFDHLKERFPCRIIKDAPMDRFTSMGVGGPADLMIFPDDEEELAGIVQFAKERSIPFLVIGKGTNLIVKDRGIRGIVINTTDGLNRFWLFRKEYHEALFRIQAGVTIPELIYFSMFEGYSGLEFASGIPGTIGGAVVMNAGGAEGQIADIIYEISYLTPSGRLESRRRKELKFSYRQLESPKDVIVTEAILRFFRVVSTKVKERINESVERRANSQPLDFKSAGSIFKNPPEAPAGKIIDQLGLKGRRIGGAMVSEMHGNFIINTGGAKASDVIGLIELVREEVLAKRGISLELEVKIVGE